MLWIKRNKIHLDCFTHDPSVANDNPIEKASTFIPDWWKRLPNFVEVQEHGIKVKRGTMKSCLGFIDLYSKGLVIPLWSDLNLKADKNNISYLIARNTNLLGDALAFHTDTQHSNNYTNQVHFKLITPWFFKEKSGAKFLFTGCGWNTIGNFPKIHILNGVLEFSNMFVGNINGFMSLEGQPYQYDIEAGTPLVQMIPLTEKEVVPHIHVVDNLEWMKMNYSTQSYKFMRWGIHKNRLNKQ